MVASSCFPSLWFKLVLDFDFCIKKLYKNSETETTEKRRTYQEQMEYGILKQYLVLQKLVLQFIQNFMV